MTNENTAVEKPKISLAVQMGRQTCDYFTGPEWPSIDQLVKPINFILRGNGLWEVRKNDVGIFIAHKSQFKIPGFPKEEEARETFLVHHGKIPYSYLEEIQWFFRDVCNHSGNEVYAQIFWNPKKNEWFNHVPLQEVSKASVKYLRNEEVERDNILVLEIHSHNTMGAFFSSVDDSDEKGDRLFGVIGQLDKPEPQMKFSYVCGGKRIEVSANDIFDMPTAVPRFPKEWKERIITSTTAVGGTNSYHQGQYGSWKPEAQAQSGRRASDYGYGGYYWPDADEDERPYYVPPAGAASSGATSQPQQQQLPATTTPKTESEIKKEVEAAAETVLAKLDDKLQVRNFVNDKVDMEAIKNDSPPEKKTISLTPATSGGQTVQPNAGGTTIVRKATITKVEPEVSTEKPFFPQGATSASGIDGRNGHELSVDDKMAIWQRDQELVAWDAKFELIIRTLIKQISSAQHLSDGVEMNNDQKKALFQEMLANCEEEDISILAQTMSDMGHQKHLLHAVEPGLEKVLDDMVSNKE